MKWWHQHWWITFGHDVLGLYMKQEGQGIESIFACRGEGQACNCGEARIKPHNPHLRPVGIVL